MARNGHEFASFVIVNCGCAILVIVLAVEFICHPKYASNGFVCSPDVGQKWLINQLMRVNLLLTVLAVEFTPLSSICTWHCMDSKESSMLVVFVAGS